MSVFLNAIRCWSISLALLTVIPGTGSLSGLSVPSNIPKEKTILLNNRILVKINGKSISTYDIMKKMDVSFYREFPQYISVVEARYEYYLQNWMMVFQELITKELILADAQEHKVVVSNGDTRQEMEVAFGPDIIGNLDKIGISFEEAFKIIQGDLTLQRMINGRVNGKALQLITPSKVQDAYQEFIQNQANYRPTLWRYQVITLKSSNSKKNAEAAQTAYQLLLNGMPLEQLPEAIKKTNLLGAKGTVNLSETLETSEPNLSKTYQEILAPLETGMYSQPVACKTRSKKKVFRIFYVEKKTPGSFPSFSEMELKLRERLLNDAAEAETKSYIQRLEKRHRLRSEDLEKNIPSDYQPFKLI